MGWISVDKLTPSRYEDVLVFDSNEDVYIATLHIDDGEHFINDCSDGITATHWQPLPEPPK